jgi:hypothetical protein
MNAHNALWCLMLSFALVHDCSLTARAFCVPHASLNAVPERV